VNETEWQIHAREPGSGWYRAVSLDSAGFQAALDTETAVRSALAEARAGRPDLEFRVVRIELGRLAHPGRAHGAASGAGPRS